MTHEAARRTVSRLWLRAFAGIVAGACSMLASPASADVPAALVHPVAAFSQPVNGRTPAAAFATEAGLYELDTAGKSVRVWQRSDEGLELLCPRGVFPFQVAGITLADTGEEKSTVSIAGQRVVIPLPVPAAPGDFLRGPNRNHQPG